MMVMRVLLILVPVVFVVIVIWLMVLFVVRVIVVMVFVMLLLVILVLLVVVGLVLLVLVLVGSILLLIMVCCVVVLSVGSVVMDIAITMTLQDVAQGKLATQELVDVFLTALERIAGMMAAGEVAEHALLI